jgi:hypothetical protein
LSKNYALTCATIIDGMYANSTDTYTKEIACFVDDRMIESIEGGVRKQVSVIPNIKKEHFLEVDTSAHYK